MTTLRRSASAFAISLVLAAACAVNATPRQVRAERVTVPPVVDGRLDDACWAAAEPTDGFMDFETHDAPTQPTFVRVCYDSENLYAAFECFEEDMAGISAALSQRDDGNLFDLDDCVAICLDTFNDDRSCYVYAASVNGTKLDLHASECGRSMDMAWDAVWSAAASREADRWTLEMAIPFGGMRFDESGDGAWGVEFLRHEAPHRELSRWVHVDGDPTDASMFGDLLGLHGLRGASGLEVLPYVLGRYDTSEERDYLLSWEGEGDLNADLGVDLEYSPWQSVTLNATLNPDFAQIESDPYEINLTGDELWLEERRPFFSENADLYTMPLDLLYTRRMEDIVLGAKGTGRIADGNFAALYVRSDDLLRDENGSVIPGDLDPVASDYGALVYKHDVMGSGTLGGLFATRERDDGHSRVAAATAGLSPMEHMRVTGLAARTWNSGAPGEDDAAVLELGYDTSRLEIDLELSSIGESFSPEMGFVGVDSRGRRGAKGSLWREFQLEPGSPLNEYSLSVSGGRYESLGGELEDYWYSAGADLETPNLIGLGLTATNRYDSVDYPEHPECRLLRLDFETNSGGWHGVAATLTYGDYHNSDYYGAALFLAMQPAPPLTIGARGEAVALREHRELDWIVDKLVVRYSFSNEMFLRAIAQGSYVREGDPDVPGDDGYRFHRYDLNMLYGWELTPGSMLYVAYNQAIERFEGESEVLDPVFVVKVSYLLSL